MISDVYVPKEEQENGAQVSYFLLLRFCQCLAAFHIIQFRKRALLVALDMLSQKSSASWVMHLISFVNMASTDEDFQTKFHY